MAVLGANSKKFFELKINNYDNQVLKNQKLIYQKLKIKVASRDRNRSRDGETLKKIKSKVDIKNHIAKKLNKWSFYDSTTNNNLVE